MVLNEVFSTTLLWDCFFSVAVDGVFFTAVLKPKLGGSHRLLIALFRLLGTEYILKQQFHLYSSRHSGNGRETQIPPLLHSETSVRSFFSPCCIYQWDFGMDVWTFF